MSDDLTRALTGRARILGNRGAVYTIQAERLLDKAAKCFAKAEALREVEARAAVAEAQHEEQMREAAAIPADTTTEQEQP